MIDFPRAWEIARSVPMAKHDERCSYRRMDGGLLCDCEVLTTYPGYADPFVADATPPAPRADDGGAAMAEAVDALIAAVGGEYPGDAETAARARVLALHAEAVAAAEAAEAKVAGWWGDAVRVVNAAVAEGRASAFAEVTAAIEALALGAWNGSVSISGIGTPPETRWSAGSSKTKATDDLVRVTPLAALFAAERALAPAQESDDE